MQTTTAAADADAATTAEAEAPDNHTAKGAPSELPTDCRKTPICKQVGVKFMPNYAFEWKLRSITAKNEKNMRFLELWIAYFLRFIATNLSLTQFVT